jgi:hypothetical protein
MVMGGTHSLDLQPIAARVLIPTREPHTERPSPVQTSGVFSATVKLADQIVTDVRSELFGRRIQTRHFDSSAMR